MYESVVIFAGPSIEQEAINTIIPTARVEPPVERGDIVRILNAGRVISHIGIVDGRFFQNLSISPKEVLQAIDAGVKVYGSSSMGALRAVELAPYGMHGIGQIFELYQSRIVDGDDEVALVYDIERNQALSEPMINIRIALERAKEVGIICESEKKICIDLLKNIYFLDRTYKSLIAALKSKLDEEIVLKLQQFFEKEAPNAKRDDAVALLKAIKQDID